jgi:hypothetical protein
VTPLTAAPIKRTAAADKASVSALDPLVLQTTAAQIATAARTAGGLSIPRKAVCLIAAKRSQGSRNETSIPAARTAAARVTRRWGRSPTFTLPFDA